MLPQFPRRGRLARLPLQHLPSKAAHGAARFSFKPPSWPRSRASQSTCPPPSQHWRRASRLYLGFWRFPDTTRLPRGAAFPCLREFGLCSVVIEPCDIEFVLSRSPVLDALYFEGHMIPKLHLRLISQSLRCVQIHASKLESSPSDAPRRLEPHGIQQLERKSKRSRRFAGLQVFGYFELGKDVLQIGNTAIKAGEPLNPNTMVATIKVLAVQVRFGVCSDAKMLPSFLRCFPNLKALHIHSVKTSESTGRLNPKFWQESGTTECIQSHITMMAFHDFHVERSELSFLKFFVQSAQRLKTLVVQFANGCVSSWPEAKSQVKALFDGKRGAAPCSVLVVENRISEDGDCWDFERGSEYDDPFSLFQCKGGLCSDLLSLVLRHLLVVSDYWHPFSPGPAFSTPSRLAHLADQSIGQATSVDGKVRPVYKDAAEKPARSVFKGQLASSPSMQRPQFLWLEANPVADSFTDDDPGRPHRLQAQQ
ncbi:hypothetical protein PR202_ga30360 [Eleusine coracana subsp. coracana]|uniref:FBD domain-containing protein n=1 Tax=Eleusine coracana subsp. coracana TaxID=191504 RepID=A0AAV5DP24_ELECO|nr:hypothetical protein PR202_ga30360 [Eleusine coracana subsp. coracana]